MPASNEIEGVSVATTMDTDTSSITEPAISTSAKGVDSEAGAVGMEGESVVDGVDSTTEIVGGN